eukprot:TRINITY_DN3730_c0_g3_i1.p3 TRINITY_DN3730_c0_g3~~TRINITY_DN3730_c0_g3_i1.p3  ORF type:complete len:102 (-),score=12.78 TRINITY_DN3730_c0_g3_i1:384-650(-)
MKEKKRKKKRKVLDTHKKNKEKKREKKWKKKDKNGENDWLQCRRFILLFCLFVSFVWAQRARKNTPPQVRAANRPADLPHLTPEAHVC